MAGVVSVTPDAVLIRWATHLGAGRMAIIFFKLLFIFFFMITWVVFSEGRSLMPPQRLIHRCRGGLRFFVTVMIIQGLVDIFFPLAFMLTYAANVLLLYSLQPIWSAILGWIFLRDPLAKHTIVALAGAIISVAIMFSPRLINGQPVGWTDYGNVIAIGLGIGMSAYVMVSRAASQKAPDVPLTLASAMGALLGGIAVASFASLIGTSTTQGISGLFFLVVALDGICVGSVFIAFTIAPRYISGLFFARERVRFPERTLSSCRCSNWVALSIRNYPR